MAIQDELQERLDILQSSNLIEEKVVCFCQRVIELLFEARDSYPTECLEIFITHLAMATQRIIRKEAEVGVDETIMHALKSENSYVTAEKLLQMIISEIDVEFPSSEKSLLLLHLCNICSSK